MKGKSRSIHRTLCFSALTCLLIAAITVGVLWLRMIREDRLARVEIQKRLEAMRTAGQPLTAQDLAKLYPDPPSEHDAVLLLKPALAALVIPDDSTNVPFFSGDWPIRTAPLNKTALDEIQTYLDKNQNAFESVPWEQLQDAWIGCSFQNGFTNLVYAPVHKINSLVKLLCLDAIFQSELGHPKEAVQFLQKAVVLGNTWRNDFPIHSRSKLASKIWVCSALERVINRTDIADSDLQTIFDHLPPANLGITKQDIINERCFSLFQANQIRSLAKSEPKFSFSPTQWFIKSYQARIIYRDQDLLNYLKWNEHCLAAMDMPLSNAIPFLLKNEQDAKKLLEKEKNSFFNPYFLNQFKKERVSLLTLLEPQVSCFLLPEANAVARVRVTRTALAIERWRLVHDHLLPDSLTDLVPNFLPSMPIDPFDGQSLRFKKLTRGYIVYSVGSGLTTDGKQTRPINVNNPSDYDISFTVDRQN